MHGRERPRSNCHATKDRASKARRGMRIARETRRGSSLWIRLWTRLHNVKTIQIVLDEDTLRAADREARRSRINRSALFRQALGYYLRRRRLIELEERHRRGYETHPIEAGEFDAWDRVLTWPEK